ncbi:hypothetical protein HY339_02155 [Candidatus Gottesmanbacteria bacterium]|nr:hypothetical protein [Candidatus Gottesmanbacteria bacterium]
MDTINISLPTQLKAQAEGLIDQGHYASFSDIVRSSLRALLAEMRYTKLIREAHKEHAEGKTIVLKSRSDIHRYIRAKLAA